jgi:hypothetical protein
MRARDAGSIVQVGSPLAYRGIPLQTAYCGAKHAVQGFNEALPEHRRQFRVAGTVRAAAADELGLREPVPAPPGEIEVLDNPLAGSRIEVSGSLVVPGAARGRCAAAQPTRRGPLAAPPRSLT